MNCPKKKPHCTPLVMNFYGKDYICRGKISKPVKYKGDVVALCLNGQFIKNFRLEMTKGEARIIGSLLLFKVNG